MQPKKSNCLQYTHTNVPWPHFARIHYFMQSITPLTHCSVIIFRSKRHHSSVRLSFSFRWSTCIARSIIGFRQQMYTNVNLWHGSMSFNKIGPQSIRRRCGQVLHETVSNQQCGSHQAYAQCMFNFTLPSLLIKQEAPLPQRNSASAAHMYLGWLAYLLMITRSRLVVQCTVYGKIAEVVLCFDTQTLWFTKCWQKTDFDTK